MGSNANSSVPGVAEGVGGFILTSEWIDEPFVEFDLCREGPVLIVGGLRNDCAVSRGQCYNRTQGAF